MTDPAATIRRLHQEHCKSFRERLGCDGKCRPLTIITAAYRAAVGDCAEVAESIPGLGVVGYAVAQTIKDLATGGPADE